MIPTGPSGEGSVNFLSTARFPSLRALALQRVGYQGPGRESLSVDFRLASQLDCIVADRVYPTSPTGDPHHPTSPASLDYPIPCLFDLASFHKTTSWGNPSIPSYPKLSQTHVRVRLSCKPTPSRFHVQTALSLMRTLLVHSTVLKKLYLDLFPRNGKGGYVLDEDSEEKMARLEIQARKKNVEIIWESHKDDWCASLMSKEFWRRSKEKKQRENEGNHR
ncbi:uncharacterized protein JCM6883_003796 [Sporobolomyces salmoneus]|uniref:uncharacterized protein n=1 Tax=Sporobolomyces salmoneus TaxID=183962 RepID=UPI003174ECA1